MCHNNQYRVIGLIIIILVCVNGLSYEALTEKGQQILENVKQIGISKDTTKIDYLLSLANDEYMAWDIRIEAINSLYKIDHTSALSQLEILFNSQKTIPVNIGDPDDHRNIFIVELAKAICLLKTQNLSTKKKVEYLANQIREYGIKPGLGAGAQKVLILHSKDWTIPMLDLFEDKNAMVRATAINAFRDNPDIRAKDKLMKALKDSEKWNRMGAAKALEKLGIKTKKLNANYEYEIVSE